jgi:hypothetical protein
MHAEHEVMLLRTQPQELGAQERTLAEVEGLLGGARGQALSLVLALGGRQGGKVGQRQGYGQGGLDDLDGLAVVQAEGGAQRLVALDQVGQAGLEGGGVERTGALQDKRDVVEGGGGRELVEEPEALLGKGERDGTGVGAARDRRPAART